MANMADEKIGDFLGKEFIVIFFSFQLENTLSRIEKFSRSCMRDPMDVHPGNCQFISKPSKPYFLIWIHSIIFHFNIRRSTCDLLDKSQNIFNENFSVFNFVSHVGIFPGFFIPSTNGNWNFQFGILFL